MGDKPSSRHSIERIDNNKGYSSGNCMWGTLEQQSRNKRVQKGNSTGTSGVTIKPNGRFHSRIGVGNRVVHLGYFGDLKDAVAARLEGEAKYWTPEGEAFQK